MPLTAPPSRRMAYDADASVVLYQYPTSGDPALKDMETDFPGSVADLNDEDAVAVGPDSGTLQKRIIILFPEARDLVGFLTSFTLAPETGSVEASTDTTTGLDGTWSTAPTWTKHTSVLSVYRDPDAWNFAGAVGIRVTFNATPVTPTIKAFHVWGVIASGESPDRVDFVDDATGLVYTVAEDVGDVPENSSRDRDVRLRNLSATLTANNVTISAEELYQPAGDNAAGWFTYSENGAAGPFTSSLNVGSIGPGSEVVVTIRQVIGATTPNPHAPRHRVNVGSWT